MTDHSQNTKRIAKNAMYLYLRMLVMMCVSLYTFRKLLELLGVEDYGTYNVVGGVVILFSVISNAMTHSNQRFLSYYLGKKDFKALRETFSMIINVQMLTVALILIIAETIGVWFINAQMNFAQENMKAVNIVYQFSVLTFSIQVLQIPYTSAIIAYEKMSFFSYFSIGETLLKLGVVLLLGLFAARRLVLYAILLSMSAFLVYVVYWIYCRRCFDSCRYKKIWKHSLFVEITSFSGWNMFGGIGVVGASQGINIIMNIFCGVMANAAMGVAHQVSAAVTSLVGNMQMAFNPQIIKNYASGDMQYLNSLVFRSSRFCFFLIFLFGIPLIVCMKSILSLWLTDVPEYAVQFTQLIICYSMIDAIGGSLWVANQATGKVRNYMIVLTVLNLINLPISYLLLKNSFSPVYVLIVRVLINFVILNFRIIYLKRIISFPAVRYYKNVMLRIGVVLAVVMLTLKGIKIFMPVYGFSSQICLFIISLCLSGITGYFILFSKNEKRFIKEKSFSIVRKIVH